jgi:hypothetical protein
MLRDDGEKEWINVKNCAFQITEKMLFNVIPEKGVRAQAHRMSS